VRRKRRHEEEHENHERWAIPYGDLLTLLLAFFVVMYSISSVNEGKYRVLSDSLYAAFRGEPRTLEPIEVGHKRVGSGADIRVSLVQQAILKGQPRAMLAPVPIAISTPMPNSTAPYRAVPPQGSASGANSATGQTHPEDTQSAARGLTAAQAQALAQAQAAAATLNKVADDVVKAMSDLVKKNLVVVRRKQSWVEVEIRTDILFPSGSARLAPPAVGIIRRLASVLVPFHNPIRVEGFTDDVPIRNVLFYSNWELSAARAASVVHVLSDRGIARERLAVVGFGQEHPVASNATAQGRNANRRVTVVILSTAGGSSDPSWLPTNGTTAADSQPASGTTASAPTSAATSATTASLTTTSATATSGTVPAR
jgi:chemotaxis protein MotB